MWKNHFMRAMSVPYYDFPCFPFIFSCILEKEFGKGGGGGEGGGVDSPFLEFFLERLMEDVTRTDALEAKVKKNLQGKVNRMKKKDFMGPISIEEVCLGSSAPTFSNFRFSGENIGVKLQGMHGILSSFFGVQNPTEDLFKIPGLLESLSKEEKKKRGVVGDTNELLGSFDMNYNGGFSVKLSATFYINFPRFHALALPFQAYIRVDSIVGNLFLYCTPHTPPPSSSSSSPSDFYPSKLLLMFSEMPKTKFSIKLKLGRANAKISSIFPQVSSYFVSSVRKNLWKQCVCPNRLSFNIPLPGRRVSFKAEKITTRRSAARRSLEREETNKEIQKVRMKYEANKRENQSSK